MQENIILFHKRKAQSLSVKYLQCTKQYEEVYFFMKQAIQSLAFSTGCLSRRPGAVSLA